jgi:hypothetical protein
MADWSISIFMEMLSSCGAYRTIEAIKPYSKHSGMAASLNAKDRFSLTPNTIDSVYHPIIMICGLVYDGDYNEIEIHERGAVSEVSLCPYTAAPPEFCVALSHNFIIGICETMGPDYDIIYTQHLTEGKPTCRAVYVKKGDRQSIDDLGPIIRYVPKIDLAPHEKRSLTINIRMTVLDDVVKGAEDLFGQSNVQERLTPIMENNGMKAAGLLAEIDNEKNSNLVRILGLLNDAMGQKNEISLVGDEIRGETFSCPFNDRDVAHACHLFEAVCNGVCKKVDPRFEFTYYSKMTRGDKTCRWAVRKIRPPTEKQLVLSEEKKKNALKALALKYAGGEITKTEYDELRKMMVD